MGGAILNKTTTNNRNLAAKTNEQKRRRMEPAQLLSLEYEHLTSTSTETFDDTRRLIAEDQTLTTNQKIAMQRENIQWFRRDLRKGTFSAVGDMLLLSAGIGTSLYLIENPDTIWKAAHFIGGLLRRGE